MTGVGVGKARVRRAATRPSRSPGTGRRSSEQPTGAAEVAGVSITHPDRVVYPAQGVTKRALAQFYESIADWILPDLRSRPTTLLRCPEGLNRECFYQKHAGPSTPASLRRVRIREKSKTAEYLVVEDLPGLIGLVQMGILEVHTWGSRVEHLEQPDRLVFDLDPGEGVPWAEVIAAARLVRARLVAHGLGSFVKTTGGKGLHVVVPLTPGPGWDDCVGFARALAESMAAGSPRLLTASMAKAQRKSRIFVDYLRNVRGATTVAAYSTRARPGAPVSTPLGWDELDSVTRSDQFTIATLPRRLGALETDPWASYGHLRQVLPSRVLSRSIERRLAEISRRG